MGEEALNSPSKEDQGQTVEPTENTADDSSSEDQGSQQAAPEVEIVLDGEEGSQPKDRHLGVRKRINKLNARVEAANESASQTAQALAAERNKNQVLELALAQAKEQQAHGTMPNPDDFDDGAADANYRKALQDYNQTIIAAEVAKQTANTTTATTPDTSGELRRVQTRHYEEAGKLGVKDYGEIEDKAIDSLGRDAVNWIIAQSDKSHLILYHLGKNPDKADNLAGLIDTNLAKAIMEIGKLEDKVKVKPMSATQSAPDPDDEIKGGSPTAGQANKFQKRLDKAREQVGETRTGMRAILDIKKAAKEAGVTLT